MEDVTPLLIALGGLAFAIGVAMVLWVRRRRFYRRNAYGADTFQNYGGMLGTRAVEKLVGIVGGLLIAIGGFFLFAFLVLPHLPRS